MKRKKVIPIVFYIFLLIITNFTVMAEETIYQVSTLNALFAGVYDGEVTFAELKKHGDTGLGTFAGLDGEMIQLDGEFYQIKADGKVYQVSEKQKTPFAVVSFFEADKKFEITQKIDFTALKKTLNKKLSSDNIFYLIKIKGYFPYIKTRSVPKQDQPYPPLSEVVKNQPIFELKDVWGTIVGIKCPPFVTGINLPGYHFHFITIIQPRKPR